MSADGDGKYPQGGPFSTDNDGEKDPEKKQDGENPEEKKEGEPPLQEKTELENYGDGTQDGEGTDEGVKI